MAEDSKFYYFAYGSNLLSQRIILANPSSQYLGVGRLTNYTVIFCEQNEKCPWGPKSATASITPREGEDIFGAVWILDKRDLASLDKQEGVPSLYTPFDVPVELLSGEKPVSCKVAFFNHLQ